MKAKIQGTMSELRQLWDLATTCALVRVDVYKLCMVPDNEQFTVTEEDLERVGLINCKDEAKGEDNAAP